MNQQLIAMNDLNQLGDVFVKSHFFADSTDAAKAIVKILAGRELGFGPVASMTGVYIVSGKPALSSNLIGARIKGSGRYDYRVLTLDEKQCSIDFYELAPAREKIGSSTFTLDDAKRAGTKNLDRFPRNMLFARALTNGARWYCPDVFNGAVYTPDELGAEVVTNAEGEIVTVIDPQPTEPELKKLVEPELTKQAPPVRQSWAASGKLITRISNEIPYYGEIRPHIIASLQKLGTEGKISLEMTNDEVFEIVNAHASEEAAKKADKVPA